MAIINSTAPATSSASFKYNRSYIFLVSTIAALGGLLFGYDIANISGTIHFFSEYFQLNELQTGWGVGCISVGAAIGALASGKVSDVLGRRKILIIAAILFALTGAGTGWAPTFTLFILFRVLSGIAIGCATVICPIYIAEISPAIFRGRLVSYYQLAITLGVLLAYLSNYFLLGTGVNNWRWMFSSQSIPAVLFLFGLFFVLESPRWLIMKRRDDEARIILEKIGGPSFAASEINAIHQTIAEQAAQNTQNIFAKNFMHIIVSGVGIAIFSQLGGPFVAYGPEIFKDAGVAQDSAFLQSVIIGGILFLFTLVAIYTVEKAGRKHLLLYGAVFLLLDTVAVAGAFYFHVPGLWVLILALIFTAVYAATVGPVTWVVLSEIFPNRIRGQAMSLATLALWVTNFLNNASFPVMRYNFGMALTFGIYAPVFLIYIFFVYIRIPETKGKSLEEIEQMLTHKPHPTIKKYSEI